MKGVALDAGPIISLSLNNMLWVFRELRSRTSVPFYITEAVKREIFDRPISIKRFEIKAIQILDLISDGVIEMIEVDREFVKRILNLANECFLVDGKSLQIVHSGEIESLSAVIQYDLQALAVDETNMRLMIEAPKKLKRKLSSRLHKEVKENVEKIKEFQNITKRVKTIRSAELLAVAYEMGSMNRYYDRDQWKYIPNIKERIIDAMLWGVKLAGCSLSAHEIEDIKRYLLKKEK